MHYNFDCKSICSILVSTKRKVDVYYSLFLQLSPFLFLNASAWCECIKMKREKHNSGLLCVSGFEHVNDKFNRIYAHDFFSVKKYQYKNKGEKLPKLTYSHNKLFT